MFTAPPRLYWWQDENQSPVALVPKITLKFAIHNSLIPDYYFLPLSGNTPVLRYSYTPWQPLALSNPNASSSEHSENEHGYFWPLCSIKWYLHWAQHSLRQSPFFLLIVPLIFFVDKKAERHPDRWCLSIDAPVCKGQSLASDDLRHVCRRVSFNIVSPPFLKVA